MKKNNINAIWLIPIFFIFTISCEKESIEDIGLVNYDSFESGEVDDWISENLTDPYNIEVVYRYSRDQHDLDRNISPPEINKVIPQMEIVIEGFLKVFEKVGGSTFIKTYSPKQFVLFGSNNYRDDGVVIAGTADAGRRITLYGLNNLNSSNANSVLGNLGTIYHEFTHILNQIRTIPPDYELVSVGDYFGNWNNNDQNPESLSRSLGFISQYARSSVGEDFAETLSTLIVDGQGYFDKYATESGEEGWGKLKRKEAIVRDYLLSNFEIDLDELQYEFIRMLTESYNSTAYSAYSYFTKDYLGTVSLNLKEAWAVENTVSEVFSDLYNQGEAGFNNSGYTASDILLAFESPEKAILQVNFSELNGQNSYWAYYDLDIQDEGDGKINFSLSSEQGEGAVYNNAAIDWVLEGTIPVLSYFIGKSFSIDWHPADVGVTPDNFQSFIGLYTENPADYVFGPQHFKSY